MKKKKTNQQTRIAISSLKAWTLWKTYTGTDLLRHLPAHGQRQLQLQLLFPARLRPGLLELRGDSRGRRCWETKPSTFSTANSKKTGQVRFLHPVCTRSVSKLPQGREMKLLPRVRGTGQDNLALQDSSAALREKYSWRTTAFCGAVISRSTPSSCWTYPECIRAPGAEH